MKYISCIAFLIFIGISLPVSAGTTLISESGALQINTPINDNAYIAWGVVDTFSPILGDAFIAGGKLRIGGSVGDNALIAGGTVDIEETIKNDAFIAGGTVTVRAPVEGDLRIAGGDITLMNSVWGDVNIAWGMVRIASGTKIGKDVMIGGWEIQFAGTIERNAEISAQKLSLDGVIRWNLKIFVDRKGEVIVGKNTKVSGTVEYTAPTQILALENLAPGKVKFTPYIEKETSKAVWFFWAYMAYRFLFLLVFGTLLYFLFERFFLDTGKYIMARPGKSIINGILYYVLLPIGSIILIITIIGIPLGIFWIFFFIFSFVLAKLVTVLGLSGLAIEQLWGKSLILWKKLLVIAAIALIIAVLSVIDFIATLFVVGAVIGVVQRSSRVIHWEK